MDIDTIVELLSDWLREDATMETNGAPLQYRHELLRAAMHWKIKELERKKKNE